MRKVFLIFAFLTVWNILFSQVAMAKVEYEGAGNFLNLSNWDWQVTDPKWREKDVCDRDEVIDLTNYRGKTIVGDFLRPDERLGKVSDPLTGVGLACLMWPYEEAVFNDDILNTDNISNDIYKDDYLVKEYDLEYKEYAVDSMDVFDMKSPHGIITVDAYFNNDMQNEQVLTIADRAGEWVLRNKGEFSITVECLPTAKDYESCGEINTRRSGVVAKGKIIKQVATISRRVIIRDNENEAASGVDGIGREDVSIISAPNTGFINSYSMSLVLLSLLGVVSTWIAIKRR